VLGGVALATLGVLGSEGGPASPEADRDARIPVRASALIGESTQGKPIRARILRGSIGGPVVLAVGAIHGDEPASAAVVRGVKRPPPRGVLVAVPSLNPDGLTRDTRTNARGVDLNRNFASDWDPSSVLGDPEHSGPRPFSEVESRLARSLVRRLRPDVTVWFHQQHEPPLVRAWGRSVEAARTYARLANTPFEPLPWRPGSAPNWQNHRFGNGSAFVVELPWGEVPKRELRRHARALLKLANEANGGGA
jgi:murein peptide amidase A